MPESGISNGLKPDSNAGNPPNSSTNASSTSSAAAAGAKRRRTSGAPSSRGVANLTAEQLARKRANDREAQRAIRERTKNQIETLQGRINELENQQPYHELQIALRQKEAVERENEDIRRRLASVWNIVQPIIAARGTGLEELAAAASRSPLLPHPSDPADASQLQLPPADLTASVSNHTSSGDSAGRQWFAGAGTARSDGQDTSTESWQGSVFSQNQRTSSGEISSNIQPDLQTYGADERLGVSFLLDDPRQSLKLQQTISNDSVSPTLSQPSRRIPDPSAPYAAIPRHLPATCPLDNILLDAVAERVSLLEAGRSPEDVVGPEYPNFTILIKPETRAQSHPISQLLTDILRTFPDISRLPEQVGIIYTMFLVFRWHVHPTAENFKKMPDWLCPRVSQVMKEHPHWVDYLLWPRLRDLLTQMQTHVPFEQFFIPFTTTIRTNWPYEPRDCLIEVQNPSDPQGDKVWIMNPAFETHIRNLENWTLGPRFKEEFPDLAEGVKLA